MQRLISIALYFDPVAHRHGSVNEYLVKELSEGWRVVQIHPVTESCQHYSTPLDHQKETRPLDSDLKGWLFVVLERPDRKSQQTQHS